MKGYEIFIEELTENIRRFFGEGYKVEVHSVTKNNSVILRGMNICKTENNLSPTIYLEEFYKEYEEGKSMSRIVMDIYALYEKIKFEEEVDFSFFTDYEKVRGHIFMKLVNRERNELALQNMPHIPYLDLAVVFYYSYLNDYLGNGSIAITTDHLDKWGISEEELFKHAWRNTRHKMHLEIKDMHQILHEMLQKQDNYDEEMMAELEEILSCGKEVTPMYVMTFMGGEFGAICLYIMHYLDDFAKKKRCNLYILPSSIHELILVPDDGMQNAVDLRRMVMEVNSSCVSAEEQLSDNIYYYDRGAGKIEIL